MDSFSYSFTSKEYEDAKTAANVEKITNTGMTKTLLAFFEDSIVNFTLMIFSNFGKNSLLHLDAFRDYLFVAPSDIRNCFSGKSVNSLKQFLSGHDFFTVKKEKIKLTEDGKTEIVTGNVEYDSQSNSFSENEDQCICHDITKLTAESIQQATHNPSEIEEETANFFFHHIEKFNAGKAHFGTLICYLRMAPDHIREYVRFQFLSTPNFFLMFLLKFPNMFTIVKISHVALRVLPEVEELRKEQEDPKLKTKAYYYILYLFSKCSAKRLRLRTIQILIDFSPTDVKQFFSMFYPDYKLKLFFYDNLKYFIVSTHKNDHHLVITLKTSTEILKTALTFYENHEFQNHGLVQSRSKDIEAKAFKFLAVRIENRKKEIRYKSLNVKDLIRFFGYASKIVNEYMITQFWMDSTFLETFLSSYPNVFCLEGPKFCLLPQKIEYVSKVFPSYEIKEEEEHGLELSNVTTHELFEENQNTGMTKSKKRLRKKRKKKQNRSDSQVGTNFANDNNKKKYRLEPSNFTSGQVELKIESGIFTSSTNNNEMKCKLEYSNSTNLGQVKVKTENG